MTVPTALETSMIPPDPTWSLDPSRPGPFAPIRVTPTRIVAATTPDPEKPNGGFITGFTFVQPPFTTTINGSTITITFTDTFAAHTYTELQVDLTLDGLPAPNVWPLWLEPDHTPVTYGSYSGRGSVVARYQAIGPATTTGALFPSLQDIERVFVPEARALVSGAPPVPCTP